MSYSVKSNFQLSQELGVSHPTIGRWVAEALANRNLLQLQKHKNRYVIIDNSSNQIELLKLRENTQKYRNKKSFEILNPLPEPYQTLTSVQLTELITKLEYESSIPMKFCYVGKGGCTLG